MSKVLISICVVFLLLGAPGSFAQMNPTPSRAPETKPSGYPVVLGDEVLFHVHGYVEEAHPEDRAREISARIKGIAEDLSVSVDTLTTFDYAPPITILMAGNRLVMIVLEQDAQAEGLTREKLAKEYIQKVRIAIEKYRQAHSLKRKVTGLLYTLIATLALIAILYFFNRIYRKQRANLEGWLSLKKVHIGIQSFEVIPAESMKIILLGAMKILRILIILVLVYTYVHLLLSFFPKTEAFANQLFNGIKAPLRTIGGAIWAWIPNLFVIFIIAVITGYVLKLMRLFFTQIQKGSLRFRGFYPEWAHPTYKICRVLVAAFAAVVAFPYIPASESPAFKGVSIFLGVLFSLGSTSAMANVIAGYALVYRRAFKIGDRVKIADFTGDVVESRLQVTHLRTVKNEEIIVPNSMIVNSHVVNYSSLAQKQGLILHTTVTIGYDTPWRQVHALLLMAAEKTERLLKEPGPFILQKSLDDFYVSYELNVYTDSPHDMAQTYSELHKNIQDAFNEYGVQIMSPSYRSDPDRPKVVPKERWYESPAKPPDGLKKQG